MVAVFDWAGAQFSEQLVAVGPACVRMASHHRSAYRIKRGFCDERRSLRSGCKSVQRCPEQISTNTLRTGGFRRGAYAASPVIPILRYFFRRSAKSWLRFFCDSSASMSAVADRTASRVISRSRWAPPRGSLIT